MIYAPTMLMIGSTGRNSGKTDLACSVIRRFRPRHEVVGVKVTTVDALAASGPRGGWRGAAGPSLKEPYSITEETNTGRGKATDRLIEAGARSVYWLRVLKDHLEEGASALFDLVGPETALVCESNSLRAVVDPGLFLMVDACDSVGVKASAESVMPQVDRLVSPDNAQPVPEFVNRVWTLPYAATAIILAGGISGRMGRDKGLLPVDGKPLIECVRDQLHPHFAQLLLSAKPGPYDFLGIETTPDNAPGRGPLMGILSALDASNHALNLVVACDIPEVPLDLVRRMFREAGGCDAVVPLDSEGRPEPLLAVWRSTMIEHAQAVLLENKRRPMEALGRANVRYIPLGGELRNINAPEDYERFLRERRNRK